MTHTEFKEYRARTGLSQKDFGALIYRTRDSVAKYESGQFTIPAHIDALLVPIMDRYKVNFDDVQ